MTTDPAAPGAAPTPPPDPADIYARRWPDTLRWEDWLRRWADPKLTVEEALGLLHVILENNRLWDPAPVRFLFTVAVRIQNPTDQGCVGCRNGGRVLCAHTRLRDKARSVIASRFFKKAENEYTGYEGFYIPEKLFEEDPTLIGHVLEFFRDGNGGFPTRDMERFAGPFVKMLMDSGQRRMERCRSDDLIGETLKKDPALRELLARTILTLDIPHHGFFQPNRDTLRILRKLAFEPDVFEKRPKDLEEAFEWMGGINAQAAQRIPRLDAMLKARERKAWKNEVDRATEELNRLREDRKKLNPDSVAPKLIRDTDKEIQQLEQELVRLQSRGEHRRWRKQRQTT